MHYQQKLTDNLQHGPYGLYLDNGGLGALDVTLAFLGYNGYGRLDGIGTYSECFEVCLQPLWQAFTIQYKGGDNETTTM